ncbi:AraC family transcriptional regulator [Pseudomonas citronellolis]|uniref:AraC family transcriptional regulator n=1 Tax=Pseudomonas citronellolis TaxID=53408 RepID=UPI0023E3987C|nr:AraC family transcriptional regulator [Pseudomonas citronellolis]MDF3931833.1 AraC family transcriptional regulator [Pseudomonas citronellolis]
MPERTTLSSWVRGILLAIEQEGLDGRALFAELGLDHGVLDDPDARIPQDDMSRLWQRAVELSGNPAIALNMARVHTPAFPVLGYALMSSRNLAEGFERLERYQRIIAEGADVSFRRQPEGCLFSVQVHGDRLLPPRQSAESSLAGMIGLVRWITGRHIRPLDVRLAGEPPQDPTPYQALFEAPLSYGHGQCALLFSHADMTAPLPTANAELARLHDRFAGEYLARFESSRFSHQTRQVLCRLLPQGEPRREVVAEILHLSERTLQRRLQEEGGSYQQLLDDTRRELAQQYLATPHMTLLEIAYLLGFSEPSNFFRAFRRWFGVTPGEYRERL